MNKDRSEFFDCECHSQEHVMRVCIYQWADEPEYVSDVDLTFYVQGSPWTPWYKRIWIAIDYIFTGNGNEWFGSTIMRDKDLPRLKSIIKDYENRIKDLK
jgi:hypothetical protein